MAKPVSRLDKTHGTVTGYDFTADPPLIRSKAIRAKCLECVCDQPSLITACGITDCSLWPWRMGGGGPSGIGGVKEKNKQIDRDYSAQTEALAMARAAKGGQKT